jgi:hypothetical protein
MGQLSHWGNLVPPHFTHPFRLVALRVRVRQMVVRARLIVSTRDDFNDRGISKRKDRRFPVHVLA